MAAKNTTKSRHDVVYKVCGGDKNRD